MSAIIFLAIDRVSLLRYNVWKEGHLLFPMSHKVLRPEEQAELRRQFEEVEEKIGRDTHLRFVQLAEELEEGVQGS